MEITVTFDVGHAHVAAVRVLQYRNGRPPTIEEVAEVLGSKVELTNHRLRALERAGIVTIVENPFEAHVSVRDHLALEKLPAEVDENALSEAVDDFKKRQAEKAEEQMRVFEESDEEREKREKHGAMEQELKSFRAKKTKKAPWEK
jgi:DNA-binding transcriptional regulator YhcF (GntR family)